MNKSSEKSEQIVLKQLSWEQIHPKLRQLQYKVKLVEGQKNAKHEKLTLSIQILSESQNIRYAKQFKTSDLPSEAITIFSDVQNLFQYIHDYHKDANRIIFNSEESMFIIVNIVIMKSKQIKRQIFLNLNKQKLVKKVKSSKSNSYLQEEFSLSDSRISNISTKQILEESKIMVQSLIRQKNAPIEQRLQALTSQMNIFINQIKQLHNTNKTLSTALNSCNASIVKLQRQNQIIKERVSILQNQKAQQNSYSKNSQNADIQKIEKLQKHIDDHKWHIDQFNISMENLRQQFIEIKGIKTKVLEIQKKQQPKNDHVLPLFQELKKQIFVLNDKYSILKDNSSRLGQKLFITLDTASNKYLNHFRIIQNVVQKIQGDQTRHQIVGKQSFSILDLKRRCNFEIKIISSVNAGVVVGIVAQTRKNERHSFDKKQCICYDGRGFIFEQGQKVKMATKFDNGQIIRVVLDPAQSIIHWFVGYTEIGSTYIPQSMRNIKIVPYIELYDISDKIAING